MTARRADGDERRATSRGPRGIGLRAFRSVLSRWALFDHRSPLVAIRSSLGAPDAGSGSAVLLDEAVLRGLERLALASRNRRARQVGGERRSARRAPAAEFVEHRAYSPGDDLRRVDWHVYARLGTPVIRLGELPASATVRVLVDCSRSMDYGHPNKLLRARQLAAGIGYVALCQLDRVAVEPLGADDGRWTTDHEPPPTDHETAPGAGRLSSLVPRPSSMVQAPSSVVLVGGKTQAHRLFSALQHVGPYPAGGDGVAAGRRPSGRRNRAARLRPGPAARPPDPERQIAERVQLYHPGDLAVLISDLLVPGGYREGVRALQARGVDVRIVHVLAPQELRPEPAGDCDLVDVETGERRDLTLEGATITQYRQRLDAWLADIEAFCADRGVAYARIDTAQPLDQALLGNLRRHGVLA